MMIHVVPKLRTWDELRRPRSRAALRLVRSVHSQSLVELRMHGSQGAFKQTAAKFNPRIVSGSVSHLGLQVSSRLQDCHSSAHWDTFKFSKSLDGFVVGLVLPPPFGYTLLQAKTVYGSESHHPPSECGHTDRWLPCWTNGSRCHRVCCLQWPECSSIMFYHVQSVSAAKNLLYPSPAFRAWTNATENGQFRNPSLHRSPSLSRPNSTKNTLPRCCHPQYADRLWIAQGCSIHDVFLSKPKNWFMM